ncbi:MAG: phosphate starvation-inducible protein PhoH, partial [Bacteroidia bacterium]|nr:phosphate starvation-inducible protein PhoH [Bacteroidia bacterium]
MERIRRHIELDGIDPLEFYGVNNAKYNRLVSNFTDLKVVARDTEIRVEGPEESVDRFQGLLEQLVGYYQHVG